MFTFQILCLISALLVSSFVCGKDRLFALTEIPLEDCRKYPFNREYSHEENAVLQIIYGRARNILLREPNTERLWQIEVTFADEDINCTVISGNTTTGTCFLDLNGAHLNYTDFSSVYNTSEGFGYHFLHLESMKMGIKFERQKERGVVLTEVYMGPIKTSIYELPQSAKSTIDSVLEVAIPAILKNASCHLPN